MSLVSGPQLQGTKNSFWDTFLDMSNALFQAQQVLPAELRASDCKRKKKEKKRLATGATAAKTGTRAMMSLILLQKTYLHIP